MTDGFRVFRFDELQWTIADVRGTPMMEARMVEGEHGIYSAFYRLPKGTGIRKHRHRNWVQVMVLEGAMSVGSDDDVAIVPAGSCYFVPPGGTHVEKAVADALVLVNSPDP